MSEEREPSRLRGLLLGFGIGLALTIAAILLEFNWNPLARLVVEVQPPWVRGLRDHLWYLPWIVGGGLLVLRLLGRTRISFWAYAVGAVAPVAVILFYLFFGPPIENWLRSRRFDSADWRADVPPRSGMWPTRLRMIDDLIEHHQLVGLSRDSVIRMLGPADSTEMFSDWDMVYELGPNRGMFRIDSEWLVLQLQKDTVIVRTVVSD